MQIRRLALALPGTVAILLSIGACSGEEKTNPVCPENGCSTAEYRLSAPVDIVRDEEGVPHVYASTDADALYASGYAQAMDRLLEMDLMRRRALGRTAEVFGEGAVGDDSLIRTLGIAKWGAVNAASSKADSASDTYALVSAWTAGVNRRIDEITRGEAPLPIGYEALSFQPERWSPDDTFIIGKLIEFGNANQLEFDVLATLIAKYQPDAYAAIRFYSPINDTFIEPGTTSAFAADSDAPPEKNSDQAPGSGKSPWHSPTPQLPEDAAVRLQRFFGTLSHVHPGASNNWAVGPEHTTTGKSLIAGDPHQPLHSPNVMWLHQMKSTAGDGTLDVVGWSFVGTPGISLGHNREVAWTATTNYPDVTDVWDVEVSDGAVLVGTEPVAIETHNETVSVAGDDPVTVTVEEVPGYGVLLPADVSPLPIGDVGRRLLFNYAGYRETHEVDAFLAFDRAKDIDGFAAAVDGLERGSFNWVFATAGDIRYHSSPFVPDRGDPSVAAPAYVALDGDDPSTFWTGDLLDDARLPRSDGGDDGFIVTANNDPFGFTKGGSFSDDPYYFGAYFDPGMRAGRIRQRLEALVAQDGVSLEDMQSIQADTHSLIADEMIPLLQAAFADADTNPDLAEFAGRSDLEMLVTMLSTWDRGMDREKAAPLAFEFFLFRYARLAVADDLAVFFDPVLANSPTYILKIAILATRDPVGALLQEGKNRLLLQALSDASAELTKRFGAVDSGYTWADFHASSFSSESVAELDGGLLATDGGEGTVNVSEANPLDEDGFAARHVSHGGPVYRMTATFDDDGTPRAFFNMPRGVSGDPESSHWNDRTQDWVDEKYTLLRFQDADVEAGTESTLHLDP